PAQKTLACLFKTQITRCLPTAQRFALLALVEKKITRACKVQVQINSLRFIEQEKLSITHRTNEVDCDDLLSRISFRIPGSTRSRDLFFRHQYSTSYAYHSCLPRLQRRGNALSSGLGYDFFFDSESALRRLFKL
ncbi:hypothetical protein J6590_097212, partial [Homalodisca vitripennis]